MSIPADESFTELLKRSRSGDQDTLDHLVPLVYEELRELAAQKLRGERVNHTLQPTGLVNEVYLRFLGGEVSDLADRQHFLALAGNVMRRVLVDHARKRRAAKRGDGRTLVSLEEEIDPASGAGQEALDILALDETLVDLAAMDERKARVVELRTFSGFNMDEVAAALGVSKRTAESDWFFARAWLRERLS